MLAQAAQQRVPATSQHSVMLGSLANMHVLLLAQGRAMKILIGTPTYGESVTTTYFDSVMWMLQHFQAKHPHIRFEHRFQPCGMLAMVRNYFASRVLNDESFTHLLFIDADMGFGPPLIEHMIAADKPLVGSIGPHRDLDLNAFYALHDKIDDPIVAQLVAQDYVGGGTAIDFSEHKSEVGELAVAEQVFIDGPCMRVRRTGTGIMLVKREVLTAIKARYPELWVEEASDSYRKIGLEGGVLQCFESMPDENGIYIGEDFAFCRRWTEGCGGEIWSVVTETILHVGTQTVVGNYLSKLRYGVG